MKVVSWGEKKKRTILQKFSDVLGKFSPEILQIEGQIYKDWKQTQNISLNICYCTFLRESNIEIVQYPLLTILASRSPSLNINEPWDREETHTWYFFAGFVGYEPDGCRAERTPLQSGHSFQRIHGGARVVVRSRCRIHCLQRRKPLQSHGNTEFRLIK